MADAKISGLTATTTVGDTDEYVVAIGGATKKITGANLKAAVAPKAGTYITQVAEAGLSAEQALGALATGVLKNTTTTGVLSIAAGSDLPTGIPVASLADPTTGKVIGSVSNAAAAVYPPGYQFDYATFTSQVTVNATTEGTATTVIAGNSVTYDGAAVLITCYAPKIVPAGSQEFYGVLLYDATVVGQWVLGYNTDRQMALGLSVHTPSAGAHTYTWKSFGTGAGSTINPDTGGAGKMGPGFIRVTKI